MENLGCTIFRSLNNSSSSAGISEPNFLESLDTDVLYRVLKRETQPSSLSKILLDLELTGWNLHNAGNDARYTMQAMIGTVLASIVPPPSDQVADHQEDDSQKPRTYALSAPPVSDAPGSTGGRSAWRTEVERRVSANREETENRVRGECAAWDTAMGCRGEWDIVTDEVDGGLPLGLRHDARN